MTDEIQLGSDKSPWPVLSGADDLPRGAVFHRCALQVNPHHYSGTNRGMPLPGDPDTFAREMIAKAVALNISVLAITDHHRVDDIPRFRAAAAKSSVRIFPGFELTSSENVHVLCIYPEETEQDQLVKFIGGFGFDQPGRDKAKFGLTDILDKVVNEQNGIAIAAHATNANGLLTTLQGGARIEPWKSRSLLAIQIPGDIKDLPPEFAPIVKNKNPQFERKHPAGVNQAVAVINAKDVERVETLEHPRASCQLKMSAISTEGMRQAFLDPDSRIRLGADEPAANRPPELVAMTWEGGFLDGKTIRFNPNLNVLAGGRGAGKSTIIESIRAVLGLMPIGEHATRMHEEILKANLGGACKMNLWVRVYRPAQREYLIERTGNNPPVVRNANGSLSEEDPLGLLEGIQVFGQHEISELAGSQAQQERLLQRFLPRDVERKQERDAVRRELERNRQTLLQTVSDLEVVKDRLAELPRLEERLERFREAGLEEKLAAKTTAGREAQILDSASERLSGLREIAGDLKDELPIDRAFVSPPALRGLPSESILSELDETLQILSGEAESARKSLTEALGRAETAIRATRDRWQRGADEVEKTYEATLRKLGEKSNDAASFVLIAEEIARLQPLRAKRERLETSVNALRLRRRELTTRWEDLKNEDFRQLERAAKRIAKKLKGHVKIEIEHAARRDALIDLIRESVGGRLDQVERALREKRKLTLPGLVATIRRGAATISEQLEIGPRQSASLAAAPEELLLKIEELKFPSNPVIRFNTSESAEAEDWRKLDDLSTGQRATALLLILLLDSHAPLIIDQPEDDLDNRFISEGIVPRLREEKRDRQLIFSTHNANIPVLGDAEMIIGVASTSEDGERRCVVDRRQMGALDDTLVKKMIERVLEGGESAFERRRLKYGF
jgi:DNA repair ATPase RecN